MSPAKVIKSPPSPRMEALLGPTNTGKTHYAIERMLSYKTGCIGFPLRLLARENYERLVRERGRLQVALITGEEKIIPQNARYYLCTVESMPITQVFEFIAIDEVQLCADPERGHVFTDRLLRCRGSEETLFLGAETIRPVIAGLLPETEFSARERLSLLEYKGFRKITRLPKRSAIVGFSVDEVYATADLIRRQKGGAAVVMGALSPRTRNKQVEMYQSGEVDYLIATDAIGMGLNMDIHHVALAGLRKYDGARMRRLYVSEMAQIAGRAGRYRRNGTFGVTGFAENLASEEYEAIQKNEFPSLSEIYWRNPSLDFSSPKALLRSLNNASGHAMLVRGRVSDDQRTLESLTAHEEVMARASNPEAMHLLWDVCQIPDFRKTLQEKHDELVAGIYLDLVEHGTIPAERVETALVRLDSTDGDVDALMNRLSHIRTWSYVAHRKDWHDGPEAIQQQARQIEDRLSDALHDALIKRFVDKRSAVLMRSLEEGRALLAGIRSNGEVIVEGHKVGHLRGFQFEADVAPDRSDYKAVVKAARNALKPEIKKRLDDMTKFENNQFQLLPTGEITWQPKTNNPTPGDVVARLEKGTDPLKPTIALIENGLLEGEDKALAKMRIQSWLDSHMGEVLEPLMALDDQNLKGPARGIAFQVKEGMGVLPRAEIEELIADLDETGRAQLRSKRIRLGPLLAFVPPLNKPAAVRLRGMLWCLWNGQDLPAPVPADGVVSVALDEAQRKQKAFYQAVGYPVMGPRAVRIDMLDRVIVDIYDSSKDWKFQAKHSYSEWMGATTEDTLAILEAMGHKQMKPEASEEETAPETKEDAAPETEEKKDKELPWFELRRGKMAGPAKAKSKQPQKSKSAQKPVQKKKPQNKKKPKQQGPKTYNFEIKGDDKADADNPFAVLQQLKEKK